MQTITWRLFFYSFIELPTPAPLVALIDKQAGVRVSTSDLASAERRGLLWLLDEEAIFPGATGNKRNWNFSAYNREMTNWPLMSLRA